MAHLVKRNRTIRKRTRMPASATGHSHIRKTGFRIDLGRAHTDVFAASKRLQRTCGTHSDAFHLVASKAKIARSVAGYYLWRSNAKVRFRSSQLENICWAGLDALAAANAASQKDPFCCGARRP